MPWHRCKCGPIRARLVRAHGCSTAHHGARVRAYAAVPWGREPELQSQQRVRQKQRSATPDQRWWDGPSRRDCAALRTRTRPNVDVGGTTKFGHVSVAPASARWDVVAVRVARCRSACGHTDSDSSAIAPRSLEPGPSLNRPPSVTLHLHSRHPRSRAVSATHGAPTPPKRHHTREQGVRWILRLVCLRSSRITLAAFGPSAESETGASTSPRRLPPPTSRRIPHNSPPGSPSARYEHPAGRMDRPHTSYGGSYGVYRPNASTRSTR